MFGDEADDEPRAVAVALFAPVASKRQAYRRLNCRHAGAMLAATIVVGGILRGIDLCLRVTLRSIRAMAVLRRRNAA